MLNTGNQGVCSGWQERRRTEKGKKKKKWKEPDRMGCRDGCVYVCVCEGSARKRRCSREDPQVLVRRHNFLDGAHEGSSAQVAGPVVFLRGRLLGHVTDLVVGHGHGLLEARAHNIVLALPFLPHNGSAQGLWDTLLGGVLQG